MAEVGFGQVSGLFYGDPEPDVDEDGRVSRTVALEAAYSVTLTLVAGEAVTTDCWAYEPVSEYEAMKLCVHEVQRRSWLRQCMVCGHDPCECVATASFYLGEPIIDHAAHLREGDGYGHGYGYCTCGAMWVSIMGSATARDHELWCRHHPRYVPEPPEGVRLERTAQHVWESPDGWAFHVYALFR